MSADETAPRPENSSPSRRLLALVGRDLGRQAKVLVLPVLWVAAAWFRGSESGPAGRVAILRESLPLFSLCFVVAASWGLVREVVVEEARAELRTLPVDDRTIATAKLTTLALLSLTAAAIIALGFVGF